MKEKRLVKISYLDFILFSVIINKADVLILFLPKECRGGVFRTIDPINSVNLLVIIFSGD